MARILFSMLSEEGHLNFSFRIARDLQARGHQVSCLVYADFEDHVRSQGLEYLPLFPDLYPPGELREQRRQLAAAGGFREALRVLRRTARCARAAQECWLDGTGASLLESWRPDLVIADPVWPMMALLAYRAGIPYLLLSTMLPPGQEPGVPPSSSSIVVDDSPLTRLKIAIAWRGVLLNRAVHNASFRLWGISEGYSAFLERFAAYCRFPTGRIQFKTTVVPVPELPQIVLCPRELDFPRQELEGRWYAEASIDLDRTETEFPWEKLDDSLPLVYCSLGSQADRFPNREEFFGTALEVFRARKDLQLVLAVGNYLDMDRFADLPGNIVVIRRAPQLALLERAALMITHGGLGTVKECVYFGVPMLVFPLMRDQRGNAARVVYHGLGKMGDVRGLSPKRLNADVDGLLESEETSARVRNMQRRFRQLEEQRPSLEIIESALSNGLPGEPHPTIE